MPDIFPLHLFPEGALASSIVTTVWLGIFVVVYFNLRLGWVLSGLVVPGYMVPLLLLKPSAALIVLVEGSLTYLLVWFYSEYLSRHFGWSNFFGRDRFFALVLTSVIVRIVGDGWLLPMLGEFINQQWQLQFDYHNNLHSFGLIIVSLIANNFWKTGFRQGLTPLFVTVGISYLLIRYGLMELTNFSISDIGFLYEDVATSILASPKAYIILLTTAFVASRMNLFYGWDFSGILIPSLIALQWYQPEKVLFSFVEALVVLFLAKALLRAPFFQRVTIEGARKLLLFFNVSFAYKMVLAYLLLWLWPELKVSDYYGFGYVLPTLMAIKMHDKDIIARLTRATLQTSIVAALVATCIGFLLSLLPDPWGWLVADTKKPVAAHPVSHAGSLLDYLREDKIFLYRTRTREQVGQPLAGEVESFVSASRFLAGIKRLPSDAELDQAASLLADANYLVELKEGRYLLLHEKEPRLYRGTFVINPASHSDLVIEVPAPLDEHGALEAAAWIFRMYDARALVVAGSARRANKDGSADVLLAPNTFYQAFHRVFARNSVLQVRTYTPETARVLAGSRREPGALEIAEPPSTVRVKGELPDAFSLQALKLAIDNFDIAWQPTPLPNLQRDTTAGGFVELLLNHDDVRKVLARGLNAERGTRLELLDRSMEGYLQAWLLADKKRIAPAGSNLYRPPLLEQLLYFDDEVLTPLLTAMRQHYGEAGWSTAGLEELRLINVAAGVVGYELVRYRHQSTGRDYLVLAESEGASARPYWGTYVFRPGSHQPFVIEAPRPLVEVNSFEFAVAQFERLQGFALLIGGAHPEANFDHSADLVKLQNRASVFNLVGQVIQRQSGDQAMLTLQSRVLGSRRESPMPASDMLISFADGQVERDKLSGLGEQLLQSLEASGLSFKFAGGSIDAAGYDAAGVLQAQHQGASSNKEFAIAWVSPLARNEYRQQSEPTPQAMHFAALHVTGQETDLARLLGERSFQPEPIPADLQARIDAYLVRQDIVLLHDALRLYGHFRFERIVDINSRQGYLLISDAQGRWLAVANLSARQNTRLQHVDRRNQDLRRQVRDFIERGSAWLLVERD